MSFLLVLHPLISVFVLGDVKIHVDNLSSTLSSHVFITSIPTIFSFTLSYPIVILLLLSASITVLSPQISISGVLLSAYLLSSGFTCFKIPTLYIVPLHLYPIINFPFPLYPHVLICLLTQCGLETSTHVCTYTLNSYFSLLPPHFPRRQSTPVANSP